VAIIGDGAPALSFIERAGNVPLSTVDRRDRRRRSDLQHWIQDFIAWKQREGFSVWWCTLTSSPQSTVGRLRQDWQVFRKRLGRKLGCVGRLGYVMVDTTEGHGVLHFIMAVPLASLGGGGWLASYDELRGWWQEIHGAWNLDFQRIGGSVVDSRKLSCYIVAQYMKGQSALVRVSSSAEARWLRPARRRWVRLCLAHWMRSGAVWGVDSDGRLVSGESAPAVVAGSRRSMWGECWSSWSALLRTGLSSIGEAAYSLVNFELPRLVVDAGAARLALAGGARLYRSASRGGQ